MDHPHQEPRSASDGGRTDLRSLHALLDRPLDAATLDANGEAAAAIAVRGATKLRTVVVFALGEELLAMPAAGLRRADQPSVVRPVPHRRVGHLRGLCAIRGEVALCIDLRVVLEMPPAPETPPEAHPQAHPEAQRRSPTRRMLLLGDAGRAWAVEVDALLGVHSLDVEALRPPPATVAAGPASFVEGLFEVSVGDEPRRVALLDLDRLQAAMERGLS